MDTKCGDSFGTAVLVVVAGHQGRKLVARLLVVAEFAEHGAGYCLAVLFFHAAHLHAEMARFDDHADTLRRNLFLNGFSDLAGHALLDLQAPREHVHQAGHFAQPNHFFARQIGHVGLAEERQQVMLAQTEKLDVLDQHHFVVAHAERRAVEQMVGVLVIAAGQEAQRLLVALRRLAQALAIRIFADQPDDLFDVACDGFRVTPVSLVQQYFFGGLGHFGFLPHRASIFCRSRMGTSTASSPAYSKLLLLVSSTRTRSSLAFGNARSRRKISMHKFSVVGTCSRNAATSSFSERWSKTSSTSRSTKPSRSARFAIMPVAGSISPERLTSST